MNRSAAVAVAPSIRPARVRSAVSNGTRLLAGVDGNSPQVRRYRDLIEALTADLGEPDSEAVRLQVRNAAALQLHVEDLTARLARGEAVDPEAFTRATNAAQRALTALRRRKADKPRATPTPTLDAYRARRAGTAA